MNFCMNKLSTRDKIKLILEINDSSYYSPPEGLGMEGAVELLYSIKESTVEDSFETTDNSDNIVSHVIYKIELEDEKIYLKYSQIVRERYVPESDEIVRVIPKMVSRIEYEEVLDEHNK